MLLYLSIFLIPLLYYYKSRNNKELASSKRMMFGIFLFLGLFIGMGDMQGGYDRYIYGAYFDSTAESLRHGWAFEPYGKEYGYSLYNWLIAHITANRYIYILLATLLMYYLYARAFKEYLDEYPLAIIVFMGLLYYFTMTYMRQTLAVGFAWQACKYAYQRRPRPFFLLMLIAFSFHNSAVIFAIMYFIPLKKFSKDTVIKMMIILFLVGLSPIASVMMNLFGDVTESQGRTEEYAADSYGYNFFYLMVAIFFAYIMVHNSKFIGNRKKDIFFYNMGLMYCAVLLALIRFGQTGRLGWYYMFGLIYTLSSIAQNSSMKSHLRSFTILLSFVMFFRITSAWAFNLTPYKTFLTDGYPCGIYEIYEDDEYDVNYTANKLYKPAFDIFLF